MKKLSILIVLFVLALNVSAQGGISLSAFGGVNGSGVRIKDDVFKMQDYTNMKTGFSAGIKFQYEFRVPLLLEFQTFYNKCGYSLTIPETNLQEHIDFYIDFVSIPFLIGYNFYIGEQENFSISPKIGIVPSFFAHTYAKYHDEKFDTKIDNKVDWRGMFELEFAWKVNRLISIFLNFDARAGWTVITYTDISKIVENYAAPGVYNYVFSGNLGIKFKLTNREKEVYEFY